MPMLMVTALLCAWHPQQGWAQEAEICTDDEKFSTDIPEETPGVVTTIAGNVQLVLEDIAYDMFNTIVADSEFQDAVAAMLTVYIAIYGLLFTFGMIQSSVYDFLTRLIKIAIIALLLNGTIWGYFNYYVVGFFNTMVDSLINEVTAIAVGGATVPGGATGALEVLDQALNKAMSANMAVHLLSTVFTSPYGMMHAALMAIGLWSFLASLLTGIWVYLMSLVLRTLLFGIAPIFIACLLFDRTKHLFLGWLNQVISACLQPIFLFTFLSFFILLIGAAIDNILYVPVCWIETSDSMRGTPFNFNFWRYALLDPDSDEWEPYGGMQGWLGANEEDAPIFPIDIMGVLVFFILAELCKNFNHIVLSIARDIAGGASHLGNMQGALSQHLTADKQQEGTAGNISGRVNPDGTRSAPVSNATLGQMKKEGILGALKNNISRLTGRR